MFQPFEKFRADYVERLAALNKRYLVSQSYPAGVPAFATPGKNSLLLSDYDDIGLAELHHKAVRDDPRSAIIDLQKAKHRDRLLAVLNDPENYEVYWAVVRTREEARRRLDAKYKDHIRRYIANNTTWQIAAKDNVRTTLQVIYGFLHLVLKRGNQTIRVKFEDIEKS